MSPDDKKPEFSDEDGETEMNIRKSISTLWFTYVDGFREGQRDKLYIDELKQEASQKFTDMEHEYKVRMFRLEGRITTLESLNHDIRLFLEERDGRIRELEQRNLNLRELADDLRKTLARIRKIGLSPMQEEAFREIKEPWETGL
jgi:hypothetical protein